MLLEILMKFFRHMYKQVFDLKTTDEPILLTDASKSVLNEFGGTTELRHDMITSLNGPEKLVSSILMQSV